MKSFKLTKNSVCAVMIAAITVLSAFILTSCGSSGVDGGMYDMTVPNGMVTENKAFGYSSSTAGLTDKYLSVEESAEADYEAMPAEEPAAPEEDYTAGRKIIYSSWTNIETKEYESSVAALEALCEEFGAYFESKTSEGNRLDYTAERNSQYVIRVPVKNYRAFISKVGTIGTVTASGEDNKDVTEQYIDLEARLASATVREERVLVLLDNAGSLDDVLALERELADIRYEIETMTGSLRKLDSLVNFSTVTVRIYEVVEYTAPKVVPKTFGERLAQNFSDGWRNFVSFWQEFVITLSYNIFGIVTFVAIVFAIVIICVLSSKGAKKRNAKRREQEALAKAAASASVNGKIGDENGK